MLAAASALGGGEDDNDAAAAELATSVGAIANVSKGFKPAVSSEVEARFFQVRLGFLWPPLPSQITCSRSSRPISVAREMRFL